MKYAYTIFLTLNSAICYIIAYGQLSEYKLAGLVFLSAAHIQLQHLYTRTKRLKSLG